MNSTQTERIATARVFGITYRSEDYRNVVVLTGSSAIYEINDAMGWSDNTDITIEQAWVIIARKHLQLVS